MTVKSILLSRLLGILSSYLCLMYSVLVFQDDTQLTVIASKFYYHKLLVSANTKLIIHFDAASSNLKDIFLKKSQSKCNFTFCVI